MPSNPQELTGGRFARRLSLFYASVFLALGVQLPFLPVWLTAKGLDPQAIGSVLALPMILRLFAIPMVTRLADRHDALRAVIAVAAATAALGYAALGLATGPIAIAVLYALAATAFLPLFVLSDAYAVRGLMPYRQAYGPVRLWGSAAFIVANLAGGYLLDVIAARDLIWLIVAAMVVCAAVAWTLPPLGPPAAGAGTGARPVVLLLRDPALLAAAAASSLIQGSHALYYGFSALDWQAAGYGGGTIGALWALGVLAEIVLFGLSARLPAVFTPSVMIMIGAAGAFVRWLVMAMAPAAVLLPILQCLHALSFGATHLGTLAFVARAAPARLVATAQGYLAVVMGVAVAGSMAASGVLYGRFGGTAYAAMALLAGAGLLAAVAAHRMRPNASWEARGS